jgi:hypothetical protein
MQLSMLIGTLFAAVTLASPGAVSLFPKSLRRPPLTAIKISLKRSFKDVPTPVENDPSRTVQIACIECPCDVSLSPTTMS